MLFSAHELKDLSIPYPLLIRRSLRKMDFERALGLCSELKNSQVILHDFFAESCTVLWSWVGEKMGEDVIEAMFRYVFHHAGRRQFFDAACADAPPHLSVILLARSWRAHSCYGAGDHPGRFSISEDDEKFTFQLAPCGSGLRLWRKGWYGHEAAGKLTETARSWTYQREQFPYYCIHCPFLNEILPYESDYGTLLWPVDPPKNPDDTCAWHIYKDRNRIPSSYYDRLGIKKKPVPRSRFYQPGRRYFSEQELQEMAQPITDRIMRHIGQGNAANAMRLCDEVEGEFLVLHDLYVNMLAATFTFIAEHTGEEGLGTALEKQFAHCIKNQLIDVVKAMPARNKIVFMARKVFGVDICNGAGRYGGSFLVEETEHKIVFRLSPCGSGGRLIRAGCYSPMPPLVALKEKTENRIICSASRRLPLPEPIIERTFPIMVHLFTQRKPVDQGKTKAGHAWSFSKAGVPYFCCQCGMVADRLRDSGLNIEPPKKKNDSCIWSFAKSAL